MLDALDVVPNILPASLVPLLDDAVAWGLLVLAFLAGWTLSRFSRRRVRRPWPTQAQPVIPGYRVAQHAFTRELDRVRRYERSLAVLVLKLEDLQRAGNGEQQPVAAEDADAMVRAARQIMFWNVGYALTDLLRETDLPSCDVAHQRYVLVLPEAAESLAAQAAARLQISLEECAGVRVRTGTAIYRADGLTIPDLVRAATEKCDRGATPRAVPRIMRLARHRSPRISDSRS